MNYVSVANEQVVALHPRARAQEDRAWPAHEARGPLTTRAPQADQFHRKPLTRRHSLLFSVVRYPLLCQQTRHLPQTSPRSFLSLLSCYSSVGIFPRLHYEGNPSTNTRHSGKTRSVQSLVLCLHINKDVRSVMKIEPVLRWPHGYTKNQDLDLCIKPYPQKYCDLLDLIW